MDLGRRKFLKFLLVGTGVLAIGRVLGLNWAAKAHAWAEPSQSPPSGNVAAPLNVGSTSQTKTGSLTVEGTLEASNRLKVPVGTDLYD